MSYLTIEEVEYIIDNYDKMAHFELAKNLGLRPDRVLRFIKDNISKYKPEEVWSKFLKKTRRNWTQAEEKLLIDNFGKPSLKLANMFVFGRAAIADKKKEIINAALMGVLSKEDADKIFDTLPAEKLKKLRAQHEVENRKIQSKLNQKWIPVENKLPELVVGKVYKIKTEDRRDFRYAKILSYHPKGKFYLCDFGLYRECISQANLLIGRVLVK